jgi:hypothetical protein
MTQRYPLVLNGVQIQEIQAGEFLAVPELFADNGVVCNKQTIDTSITFPEATNVISVGTLTISPGVTVTLGAGQKWSII